jgi:hypothetical protein
LTGVSELLCQVGTAKLRRHSGEPPESSFDYSSLDPDYRRGDDESIRILGWRHAGTKHAVDLFSCWPGVICAGRAHCER